MAIVIPGIFPGPVAVHAAPAELFESWTWSLEVVGALVPIPTNLLVWIRMFSVPLDSKVIVPAGFNSIDSFASEVANCSCPARAWIENTVPLLPIFPLVFAWCLNSSIEPELEWFLPNIKVLTSEVAAISVVPILVS